MWSIKAFFPPPEKEDETQRLSSASQPVSSRAVEGEQAPGTVQDDTPTTLEAEEVWPQAQTSWTGIQRPFHQDIIPAIPASLWVGVYFCSSCLIFSLSPLFFVQYNRRFGVEGCPMVSILQGTVPICTTIKPQEIINSY